MKRRASDFHVFVFFVFYAVGLLVSQAGPFYFLQEGSVWAWFLMLFLLALITGGFLCNRFGSVPFKGLWICLLSFLGGFIINGLSDETIQSRHHSHHTYARFWLVHVSGMPEEKAKTYKIEADVLAFYREVSDTVERGLYSEENWTPSAGKTLLYFSKDSAVGGLMPGNILLIKSPLVPIGGFYGKDSIWFDYGKLMRRKGFYTRSFVSSSSYVLMGNMEGSVMDSFRSFLCKLRKELSLLIDSSVEEVSERSVLKALLLGERDGDAIEDVYRDTGIVHVLAVSGMHLSVFAYMMAGLLNFMDRRRFLKAAKVGLMLFLVWGYAFFTGFSSSVARAACMFTFLVLGKLFSRKITTGRSLVFSAWGLLVWNPRLVYDLGFLLSYSAVIGITYLSPIINGLGKRTPKFWKYVVGQVSASVSAQLATLPILIFSFGTFPTYFLLANLLVCPIVNWVLPVGLFSCVLAFVFPWLGGTLLQLVRWPVSLMNFIAGKIASFPESVLPVSLSLVSSLLLYVVIYGIYRGRTHDMKRNLIGIIGGLILIVWIG